MPEDCVKYLRRDLKYKVEWAKWKQLFAIEFLIPDVTVFLVDSTSSCTMSWLHDFYEKRVMQVAAVR